MKLVISVISSTSSVFTTVRAKPAANALAMLKKPEVCKRWFRAEDPLFTVHENRYEEFVMKKIPLIIAAVLLISSGASYAAQETHYLLSMPDIPLMSQMAELEDSRDTLYKSHVAGALLSTLLIPCMTPCTECMTPCTLYDTMY